MKILLYILLVVLLEFAQGASPGHHSSWNYDSQGPDFWKEEFKNCKGQKQSPIDIIKENLEYDSNLKSFKFSNYDRNFHWNVSHNGHTVVVSKISNQTDKIRVEGSNFQEPFELLQFHFHWGFNDYHGSEHLIDGSKFPLEMHLVHKSESGNFTVLGFLFQLSKENNTGLDELLEGVNVARGEEHWQEVNFKLESILPDLNDLQYYRYTGSLTTPPCTEGVIWNVFTSYINISSFQLLNFRNNYLKINFRDPQKIYNRQVFTSFELPKSIARSKSDKNCVLENGSVESSKMASLNGAFSILASVLFVKYFKF